MRRPVVLVAAFLAACGGGAPPFGDLVPTAIEKEGAAYKVTLNGAIEVSGVRLEGKALKMPGRDRFPDVKIGGEEGGRIAAALKAGAKGQGGAALRVTDVKIRRHESGALRAFAEVTFNDGLLKMSVRILEGRNGLFVGMPSKRVGEKYEDTVRIVDRDLKRAVEDAVLEAYRSGGGAGGGEDERGGEE